MKTGLKSEKAVLRLRKGGAGIGALKDWGLIEISGPDAFSFMQARTSNDVLALQDGEGHMNTVLDRSAKIQGAFSLHRLNKSLWLFCEKEQIPHLLSELEKYHLLENVSLTERSEAFQFFALQGVDSSLFLEKVFTLKNESENQAPTSFESLGSYGIGAFVSFPSQAVSSYVVRRSLTGEPGYILALPYSLAENQKESLLQARKKENQGLINLSHADLNTLRIEAGLLQFGRDMDTGTLLPETGLEQMAVSHTKGCYLGQETVARVKTYGAVQKKLMGLVFPKETTLPARNSPCFFEGKPVGQIKSGSFSPTLRRPIAMAYLGKGFQTPGTKWLFAFNTETPEQTIEVTVTQLPFYTSNQGVRKAKIALDQGLLDFAEGREAQAILKLRTALAFNPTLADAYEALGVILSRQDEFEEAIALTHKLVALDPHRIMAHTNLSVYYMKIGDKERAEEEKAKATVLGMQQKAKEAGLSLGLEGSETEAQEAQKMKRDEATRQRIQMFKEALTQSPNDPLGLFGLASAYLELNEYGDAVEHFEKVLAVQPDNASAWLSLGKAYEGLENREKAVATYTQGIEVATQVQNKIALKTMEQRLEALLSS